MIQKWLKHQRTQKSTLKNNQLLETVLIQIGEGRKSIQDLNETVLLQIGEGSKKVNSRSEWGVQQHGWENQ
jgi:methyl-accepting chemotaxis protein